MPESALVEPLDAENKMIYAESDPKLDEVFEACKQKITRVIGFDWSIVKLSWGWFPLEELGSDAEVIERHRVEGAANGSALTMFTYGVSSPYHDPKVMDFCTLVNKTDQDHECEDPKACLRHTVMHELCHVVTLTQGYLGKPEVYQQDPDFARLSEESAVDLLAMLIDSIKV